MTNPPFSLFREFLAWILEGRGGLTCGGSGSPALPCGGTSVGRGVPDAPSKQFAIIGNRNAITYKEVFPLIKENKIWLDNPFVRGAGYFKSSMEVDKSLSYYNSHDYREGFIRVPGVRWFTNIEHGRRHQPLQLMTMADNVKYSRHKEVKGVGYAKYDNYDAIEVPFTDAIPSDYDGVMGVPISFLDKHCPEQFEIVGLAKAGGGDPALKTRIYPEQIQVERNGRESKVTKLNDGPVLKISAPPEGEMYYKVGEEMFVQVYARILIRRRGK